MSGLFFDPSREMFSWTIPILGRPILWYGFFFALGFFIGYQVFRYIVRKYSSSYEAFSQDKTLYKKMCESSLMYVMIGVIVGARLADVIFYQDVSYVLHDPLSVLRVWEGGLASHGGAIGAIVGIWLCFRVYQRTHISLSTWFDWICAPSAIIAGCIRLGNLCNQEVLGRCTTFPIALIFGHPADGGAVCPRHPVQVYEAFFAFSMSLWALWYLTKPRHPGRLFAYFIIIMFSFRIGIENLKVEQSAWFHHTWTMGQVLSIPFILLGGVMLYKQRPRKLHIKWDKR